MKRMLHQQSILVFAVLFGAGCVSPTEDESVAQESTELVEREMVVAYIDEEVARAHGYEVRTDQNGNRVSVPVSPDASAALIPYSPTGGMTVGNCGVARVLIEGLSYRTVWLETSWDVIARVVRSNWQIKIRDNAGESIQGWPAETGVGESSWIDFRVLINLAPGRITAEVLPTSTVTLENGWVCRSLWPVDTGEVPG